MRKLICLFMLGLAWSSAANAGDAAKANVQRTNALRRSIHQQSRIADAWARVLHFDEGREAIRAAERDYRALVALKGEPERVPVWDLEQQLRRIDAYEEARDVLVEKFGLPKRTLAFINAGPYNEENHQPLESGLWYAAYTVAPELPTKEQLAPDPRAYVARLPIEGARGYIASFKPMEGENGGSPPDWKRIARLELPEGELPLTVPFNDGGRLLITTYDAEQQRGYVLLNRGKLVQLKGGPCAGPARVPRPNADWMLMDWGDEVIMYDAREEGDVMCHYRYGTLERLVKIKGGDIVKIKQSKNRAIASNPWFLRD